MLKLDFLESKPNCIWYAAFHFQLNKFYGFFYTSYIRTPIDFAQIKEYIAHDLANIIMIYIIYMINIIYIYIYPIQ